MPEIEFGKFTFSDSVILNGDGVRFKITNNQNFDVTQQDAIYLKSRIEQNLGKWENLIKTSSQLLFELGIATQKKNPSYMWRFGPELYHIAIEVDRMNDCAWCVIYLSQDECRRRQHAKFNPLITTEEITTQIENIPKWESFEKTIQNVKETWSK